jgi:signal transduction histidine kinase
VTAARAVIDGAEQAAADCQVKLELAPNGSAGAIRAEPKLVERILAPLVENACHYASERASVRIGRRGQWVEMVVEDDGPGVPKGDESAVFEPGFRGPAARAGHDGAGLGLSLARRLARSAGGDVEADPGASGGRFVVRLPAAEGPVAGGAGRG